MNKKYIFFEYHKCNGAHPPQIILFLGNFGMERFFLGKIVKKVELEAFLVKIRLNRVPFPSFSEKKKAPFCKIPKG